MTAQIKGLHKYTNAVSYEALLKKIIKAIDNDSEICK